MVPLSDVQAFADKLAGSGADWQVAVYGGARHSFTNPGAAKAGMEALAYDAGADRRSWEAMKDFFAEALAE